MLCKSVLYQLIIFQLVSGLNHIALNFYQQSNLLTNINHAFQVFCPRRDYSCYWSYYCGWDLKSDYFSNCKSIIKSLCKPFSVTIDKPNGKPFIVTIDKSNGKPFSFTIGEPLEESFCITNDKSFFESNSEPVCFADNKPKCKTQLPAV